MPSKNTHDLADKIAQLLERESVSPDFSSLQASIEKINERLDGIEAVLSPHSAKLSSSPEEGWPKASVVTPQSTHPSVDRFTVIEAVGDEMIANLKNEKACTFEPNGKPCDHCSMCSSRGF